MRERAFQWEPAAIERESLSIIARELAERGIALQPGTEAVILRAIHATADFDYAQSFRFTPEAVQKGLAALSKPGFTLVTDTNMALAGLSRVALGHLGGTAVCFMAEPFIAERAQKKKATRAAASMEYALEQFPHAIFAVGNAPTALLALSDAMESRGARPALIIGVPVGFVNVAESKERLLSVCTRFGIPAIVSLGRKGGSGVAAAVCNALFYTAAGMQRPELRG